MFTFAVRPAYHSQELLIEFRQGSGTDEMITAMKKVFGDINAVLIEKNVLWQNDETIYRMKSSSGEFEVSSDNYGSIFISAPNNQVTIKRLSEALAESLDFKQEIVDFAKYL